MAGHASLLSAHAFEAASFATPRQGTMATLARKLRIAIDPFGIVNKWRNEDESQTESGIQAFHCVESEQAVQVASPLAAPAQDILRQQRSTTPDISRRVEGSCAASPIPASTWGLASEVSSCDAASNASRRSSLDIAQRMMSHSCEDFGPRFGGGKDEHSSIEAANAIGPPVCLAAEGDDATTVVEPSDMAGAPKHVARAAKTIVDRATAIQDSMMSVTSSDHKQLCNSIGSSHDGAWPKVVISDESLSRVVIDVPAYRWPDICLYRPVTVSGGSREK